MKIALLNQSAADPAAFPRLAESIQLMLGELCDAWERAPIKIQWMPGAAVAPDGWSPLVALDHPDVAGVLGYHDVDPIGRPYGRAFMSMLLEVLRDRSDGGQSLAAVLAHEAAEMAIDAGANLWCHGPLVEPATKVSHELVALETADAVQGVPVVQQVSDGTIVDGTDWLYPSFFNARATRGPYDRAGLVSYPLTLAPGGYSIVSDVSAEGQVMASRIEHHVTPLAEWRAAMKAHPGGRSARRLGAVRARASVAA